MNKLELPKNKRIKGLYIFCNCCNKKFSKPHSCDGSVDRQVYKVIITIPGSTKVKTKILDTRNLDEALKLTLDFEDDLRRNNYHLPKEKIEVDNKPQDLVGCIGMYIDYLENENTFEHQKRTRTKAHIKQITSYLKRFVNALKESGININQLLIGNLNNQHVSIFHSYLLKNEFANRTFNRHMDTVSELFKYLIDIRQYTLVNYFGSKNTKRKRVNPKIDSVSLDDFKGLLKILTPANGVQVLSTGTKKHLYFDWLKDAFELGLYTGRRRDEIINMKFSDIYEQNGIPVYIKTEDFKYNLRNNLFKEEEKKYNYSPVINDLNLYLTKIGYPKYKGTNRYLLAPDATMTRASVKDKMSKAFSHYYEQLGTGKQLQFRHLRKTYITYLNHFTNGEAETITGHSGHEIIMKNYHDEKVFNNVLKDFRMIS
jgi:integrase